MGHKLVVIIMKFLLHQNIIPKMFMVDALLNIGHLLESQRLVHIMFFFFYIKGSNCSHKLGYKGCLKLICKCFS
jgi:hypothetical protein